MKRNFCVGMVLMLFSIFVFSAEAFWGRALRFHLRPGHGRNRPNRRPLGTSLAGPCWNSWLGGVYTDGDGNYTIEGLPPALKPKGYGFGK